MLEDEDRAAGGTGWTVVGFANDVPYDQLPAGAPVAAGATPMAPAALTVGGGPMVAQAQAGGCSIAPSARPECSLLLLAAALAIAARRRRT
jgi:MYXO-CTERM domain-containing protein